jgi:PAS domain S-box-containing protein
MDTMLMDDQAEDATRVLPQPLASEPFLAALVRSSDDAIIGKTCDGIVTYWNEAAERLYGYTSAEMVGRSIEVLFPADRRSELQEILERASSGTMLRGHRTVRVRRDGSSVAISITVSPVIGNTGEVLGISTIARDLTLPDRQSDDLRAAHRKAEETASLLELLQTTAPVGLGFVDTNFRVVRMNEALAGFVHARPEALVGRTIEESTPEVWKMIGSTLQQVLALDEPVHNVEVSGELTVDPGPVHHWLASYYPVRFDDEVIGVGIVANDITERRRSEEFRSIIMDNLVEGIFTVDAQGLLTSMNDAAERMLGWSEVELLGRPMREFVLQRSGSDPSIDEGNQQLLAVRSEGRHVQLDEHAYQRKNGEPLPVAVSATPLFIGEAIHGAVVIFRDITEEQAERRRVRKELDALTWVGRIRDALDQDRFVLHTQPITPLRGGRPSEELLIRMLGRDGALIAPGAFLGVAEHYGLIGEIDRWVVGQAIQRASSGRHVGANLSAESLMTFDLLHFVEAELSRTGTDPSNLVLEITETALLKDLAKARSFAHAVVELGCSIALDDFGTGYGTFTQLKELDVAYLKVDISFVRGLVESAANQHVVKAIVNLAEGFGCETIAEGVEDFVTLELLESYGVDYAQGFYLGRPAPLYPPATSHGSEERPAPAASSKR